MSIQTKNMPNTNEQLFKPINDFKSQLAVNSSQPEGKDKLMSTLKQQYMLLKPNNGIAVFAEPSNSKSQLLPQSNDFEIVWDAFNKAQSSVADYIHGEQEREFERLYQQAESMLPILFPKRIFGDRTIHKMVEIGSGSGANVPRLKKDHPNSHIVGIEYSKKAVEFSQKKLQQLGFSNFEMKNGNAMDLSQSGIESGSIDGVFTKFVLEHISQDPDVGSKLDRYLKEVGFEIIEEESGQINLWLNHEDVLNVLLPMIEGAKKRIVDQLRNNYGDLSEKMYEKALESMKVEGSKFKAVFDVYTALKNE